MHRWLVHINISNFDLNKRRPAPLGQLKAASQNVSEESSDS